METNLPFGFQIEKVRPQNTYLWDLFCGNKFCGTFRTKKAAIAKAWSGVNIGVDPAKGDDQTHEFNPSTP